MRVFKYAVLALTQPKMIYTLGTKLTSYGWGLADSTLTLLRVCGFSLVGGALTVMLSVWYREARRKEESKHQNREGNETSSISYINGNTITVVISDAND